MAARIHSSRTGLVSLVLVSVIAISLFPLTSGPVIAYHFQFPNAQTTSICRVYLPLFRIAPSLTVQYMNWWGISEIEMFFLLQPTQRNSGISI